MDLSTSVHGKLDKKSAKGGPDFSEQLDIADVFESLDFYILGADKKVETKIETLTPGQFVPQEESKDSANSASSMECKDNSEKEYVIATPVSVSKEDSIFKEESKKVADSKVAECKKVEKVKVSKTDKKEKQEKVETANGKVKWFMNMSGMVTCFL